MKTRILSTLCLFLLIAIPGLQAQDATDADTVAEKPEGMLLDRDAETQLLASMEGGRLVVRVVDENYEPIEGLLVKGYGEVDANGKKRQKVVMRPNSEGDGLQNLKHINKPHIFKVHLVLFTSEDESSKEVYTFTYNQFTVAEEAEE